MKCFTLDWIGEKLLLSAGSKASEGHLAVLLNQVEENELIRPLLLAFRKCKQTEIILFLAF